LIKIREILTGVTAYRTLVLEEKEKIENLGGV
jgi:hypothetical protein